MDITDRAYFRTCASEGIVVNIDVLIAEEHIVSISLFKDLDKHTLYNITSPQGC
jgi:hypothetical protein